MTISLIITLVILVGLIVALAFERWPIELVILTALLLLVGFQIIEIKDALAGFANPAMLTVGALFVVGAGIQATGSVDVISRLLLGTPRPGTSLLRLIAPVAGLSAFTNNTPLVAFFLPAFVHIAKKLRISPSKLLIPLSYSAILGGTCTLIGTSTNLVVDAALRDRGKPGFGMWELSWVGIPVTIVGLIYLSTLGRRLLPNRTDLLEYAESHPREYTLELIVRPSCSLVGQTIRRSGLRDLPGLYVYAVERGGERIVPFSPDELIQVHDILCFSGVVGTIVDAQRIRGLEPVDHHAEIEPSRVDDSCGDNTVPPAAPRTGHQLCEVVISPASPLIGSSVKDANFRAHYGAPIVAVHRSGEKLQHKIGQIVLQPGDTLLVDAPSDFIRRWRNSRDFILVSGLEDSAPVDHQRAWIALTIFGCVILGMSIFTEGAVLVALIGAVLTVLTGCLPARDAHRSIELPVLLLIASSLGVGKALEASGAANLIATSLLSWASPYGNVAVLAVLVVLTGLLTELLSNNACAALMSVLAFATASQLKVDPRPFLIAVAVCSSYGFSTPIGYQTNLMVLGPGGYKFSDYLRVGMPLDLISWVMTVVIVAWVWKL